MRLGFTPPSPAEEKGEMAGPYGRGGQGRFN